MMELYSVSGIPNCSLSNCNKFKLNSEIFSCLLPSKISLSVLGSSSHYKVIISSFEAHFKTLAKLSILNPKVMGLSHL
jgi:hypothetical protein